MADIKKELNDIKTAIYGRDVRGSIHDGIDKINKESELSKQKADEAHDVMENIMQEGFDNAALEANFEQKLDDKIGQLQPEWTQFQTDVTSQLNETNLQLAQTEQQVTELAVNKIDKSEAGNALSLKADKEYVDTQLANILDGSPKGVYSTLTDLRNAYPSGTSGIYVILADGHWYYWNGADWTDGGVYQGTEIPNDSITIEKIKKDGFLKFPWLSDSTHDLDFVWEEGNYFVSSSALNNPLGNGGALKVERYKTTPTGNPWIVQTITDNQSAQKTFRRVLSVNESTSTISYKRDWRILSDVENGSITTEKLKNESITTEKLHKDVGIQYPWLSDDSFDLDYVWESGNYFIASNVLNNPSPNGGALKVERYKTTTNGNPWITQTKIDNVTGDTYERIMLVNESTGDHSYIRDWKKTSSDVSADSLNILFIGNSYSLDVTNYIHRLCNSARVKTMVGVLYRSGETLQGHMEQVNSNTSSYRYHKRSNLTGSSNEEILHDKSLDFALTDEDWDIVVLQQGSVDADDYSTYQPYLNELIDYVKTKIPNVKFAIHQTWAYSTSSNLYQYTNSSNQLELYNNVVDAYQQAMSETDIDIIIPTGTAIQNARTNNFLMASGDELTSDGTHLNELGDYIGGLAIFETLFAGKYKKDIFSDVNYIPTEVSKYLAYLGKLVVKNAVLNPFKINDI